MSSLLLPGEPAIVFSKATGSAAPHLFRQNLDTGQEEIFLPGRGFQTAEDVSSDGLLAYSERTDSGKFNLRTLRLSGPSIPTRTPAVGIQ